MKGFFIIAVAAILVVSAARGADEKVEITGSHIKQSVRRVGYSTDTVAPVYVFDRQFIDRTGAVTVADVLRHIPQARVRGF